MSARGRIPVWIALLGSGVAGTLVAMQSRINGQLGATLDNGMLAAVISFALGLMVMLIVTVCSRKSRRGLARVRDAVSSGAFPVWALFGGLAGALFVVSQGVTVGVLGVALFTIGVVAGQVVGGLALDRVGVGPGGRVIPTLPRMLGAALAIIAVMVSAWTGLGGSPSLALLIMPVIAGLGVSWQSAVNGLVRSVAQSAVTATLVNFITGTAALVVVAAISLLVRGWPTAWPDEWWWYLGGPIGCVFIALAAIFVRAAGVLLLSMANVTGQLIGAVALDTVIPVTGGHGNELLIGVGIALLAVTIASVPASLWRRPVQSRGRVGA